MSRKIFLSVMLAAAAGFLGACDNLRSLNPFSPDDVQPTFAALVPNQTWTVGTAVSLTLPEARDGNPPLTYGLSPALPAGLAFDTVARTIAGTPTAVLPATTFVYTVTDSDDDTASVQFQASVAAR